MALQSSSPPPYLSLYLSSCFFPEVFCILISTLCFSGGGLGFFGVFLAMISGVLAVLIGLYYYCQTNQQDQFCRDMIQLVQVKSTLFLKTSEEYLQFIQANAVILYDKILLQIDEIKSSIAPKSQS